MIKPMEETSSTEEVLISIFEEEIDFSFLCQADYCFISRMDDLHVTAAKYAHEHGIKVLIDADNQPLSEYQKILPYIDYFIASEFVYNESFQDTDYRQHMEEILKLGPKTVVFTFGEDGCRALSEEGYFEIPAFKVNVLDTVGAGDTFHGAFFYETGTQALFKGYCYLRQCRKCDQMHLHWRPCRHPYSRYHSRLYPHRSYP